ncbi:MAG: GLUG motif-containing protein [Candidatus Saccharibacteria bacterium]
MNQSLSRRKSTLAIFIFLLTSSSALAAVPAHASAPDGSAANPWEITNCTELQAMDSVYGTDHDHFKLMNDVDCTSISNFVPIGNNGNGWDDQGLAGEFNGNHHTISHLTIIAVSNTGLFQGLAGGNVHDLTIDYANVAGTDYVGVLGGYANNSSSVENVTVSGIVNAAGNVTGGLIGGSSSGNYTNITSHVNVTSGGSSVGGAFGYLSDGTVTDSSATGNVTGGIENAFAGGFVGEAFGGNSPTSLTNSFATGDVAGDSHVGGFVGNTECSVVVTNSYASGTISAVINAGGFAGRDGCMGPGGSYSGVHASGNVVVHDSPNNAPAGGLIGSANITQISNSYATGNISGSENMGGLVGDAEGSTIFQSYATGDIIGFVEAAGGLVGYAYGTDITESFATGNVTNGEYMGGLAGSFGDGTILNSYARGNVLISDETNGGLVGDFIAGGIIENSYSTGQVSQENSFYGGLVGYKEGNPDPVATHSFWDTQTSGNDTSVFGEGKTTSEMKTQSTFTNAPNNWDFNTIWGIRDGVNDGYPCLLWHEGCVSENDGISSNIENHSPNNGDANDDGYPDSQQDNVTSFVNGVDGKYISVQTNCGQAVPKNEQVFAESEDTDHSDAAFQYPAGLANFSFDCSGTATVTQYFYGDWDSSTVTARKYSPATHTYTTIPDAIISKEVIGGEKVLKIVYPITDNGPLDLDPTVGTITDPSGPAVLAIGAPNTGLGGQVIK